MKRLRALRIRQLGQRLANVSPHSAPAQGWIRTIREVLGMTSSQLATRIGVTASAVSQFEKAEREGRITLGSLRTLAEAMHCRLVYALVPEDELEAILEQRARAVATNRVESVWHSMALEGQQISPQEKTRQIEDLTQELLSQKLSDLWVDE